MELGGNLWKYNLKIYVLSIYAGIVMKLAVTKTLAE